MRMKNVFIAMLLVMAASFSTPRQAHAQMGGASAAEVKAIVVAAQGYIDNYTKQINQQMQDILSQNMNTDTETLYKALQLTSDQSVGNTTTAIQSQAKMMDTQDQRKYQEDVQKQKLAAIQQATTGSSVCNDITGAIATGHLENELQLWRSNIVQSTMAHDSGHIDGDTKVHTADTMEHMFVQAHCNLNMTQPDQMQGVCKKNSKAGQAQTSGGGDGNMNNQSAASTAADGMVTTADDTNADLVLNHEHMTPQQQEAMGRLQVLLADPEPMGQTMSPNTANSADKEHMYYEMNYIKSLRSIAASTMGHIIGETQIIKTKDTALDAKAQQWAEATAKMMVGYDPNGNNFPNGVTTLDIDKLRSYKWEYDAQEGIQAAAQNESAMLKDIGEMAAWNSVMTYKHYTQTRETNMLLAAILTIMVDQKQNAVLH